MMGIAKNSPKSTIPEMKHLSGVYNQYPLPSLYIQMHLNGADIQGGWSHCGLKHRLILRTDIGTLNQAKHGGSTFSFQDQSSVRSCQQHAEKSMCMCVYLPYVIQPPRFQASNNNNNTKNNTSSLNINFPSSGKSSKSCFPQARPEFEYPCPRELPTNTASRCYRPKKPATQRSQPCLGCIALARWALGISTQYSHSDAADSSARTWHHLESPAPRSPHLYGMHPFPTAAQHPFFIFTFFFFC